MLSVLACTPLTLRLQARIYVQRINSFRLKILLLLSEADSLVSLRGLIRYDI